MVGDEEVGSGWWSGLEALEAIPGHVLDSDEGAVREKEEIKEAVADDCVVCAFDD